MLYDWNGQRSHTRNGSDLVVGVGPHGWVMQPFVFNYKLLDHITFVAGCGGCSVDVHIYTDANGNNSAGEGCIVRSLPVNENAFTTAQFSACALTKNVYYYAQIFNLRADGPLAVYLVDDSGGSQNDFAYATGGTIPPSTAVRCTIVASE